MPDLVKHPPLPQGAAAEDADDLLSTDCEEAESEGELADDPMVEYDEVHIMTIYNLISNMHLFFSIYIYIRYKEMGDLSGWRTTT